MWSCGVRSRGLGKTKVPEERKEEKWRARRTGGSGGLQKEENWRKKRIVDKVGGREEAEGWMKTLKSRIGE